MLKVVIHSYAQAEAALTAAAEAGVPALLLSAPGAAAYVGPAWFRELITAAQAAVPAALSQSLLDCADRPGDALAAIRAGVPAIAIDLPAATAARIADIAAQAGGRIAAYDSADALDLAGARDPLRACRDHLAAHCRCRPAEIANRNGLG
jgi:fructose/tagatose bisphosphate aldolase